MPTHDPFERLCGSLFSKKGDLFTMLMAYFDDSGDDEVAVVAGYLSSVGMWGQFNTEWAKLLSKYGVKQMHRSELENFRGEFHQWTPYQRKQFVIRAHAIIRRCTYLPIGTAIIKLDLESVFPAGHTARKFKFYSWCVHSCLAALGKWCKKRQKWEPINFVFEAGSNGRDQVDRTLAALYSIPDRKLTDACRIASWSFAGKDVLPLQAADVVAYEQFKLVKNVGIDQGKRKIRFSAIDLFKPPVDSSFLARFDKKAFEGLRGEKIPRWDY